MVGCGQQKTSQTQPTVPTPVAQQPANQPTPAIPTNSASLQTYRNDQYGFSLNYPINWTLSEKATTDSVVKIESYFTNKGGYEDGAYFNIDIFKGISIDAQSWINKKHPINGETEELHETKTLNIDGENGIYRVITSSVAGGYFNRLVA